MADLLLANAYQGTQLLAKNDKLGDDFPIVRAVDFVLKTPDQALADLYGESWVEEGSPGQFRIVTTIRGFRTRAFSGMARPPFELPVTAGAAIEGAPRVKQGVAHTQPLPRAANRGACRVGGEPLLTRGPLRGYFCALSSLRPAGLSEDRGLDHWTGQTDDVMNLRLR